VGAPEAPSASLFFRARYRSDILSAMPYAYRYLFLRLGPPANKHHKPMTGALGREHSDRQYFAA
jgi:hypothetical protein